MGRGRISGGEGVVSDKEGLESVWGPLLLFVATLVGKFKLLTLPPQPMELFLLRLDHVDAIKMKLSLLLEFSDSEPVEGLYSIRLRWGQLKI